MCPSYIVNAFRRRQRFQLPSIQHSMAMANLTSDSSPIASTPVEETLKIDPIICEVLDDLVSLSSPSPRLPSSLLGRIDYA